jgi:hypothetical protein
MKELSLNILDIVQNSIRAKADEILIVITESVTDDFYRIVIIDNGTGIPDEILRNVTDPFVTTRIKRKMGLGLSLLKYHTELTGGGLGIKSETGKGTEVIANFSYKHIDRQPLGDIIGVLIILMAANEEINFIYRHKTEKGGYRFSSRETKQYLETDTLYDNSLLEEIGCMIRENLREIDASGFELKESYKTAL